MQKISPCLWFDGQAEEAANFYVSTFRNAEILVTTRYIEGSHRPVGSVMTVQFVLDGQEFVALNGGPQFTFSPAVSFIAYCEDQQEVDHMWEQLSAGGQQGQCGWLTDRFGVSWQVVPVRLIEMLKTVDQPTAQRVTAVLMTMKKLDIVALEAAARND
jgi:predicted 3-demethylubiquinone-9 3-methyltransferase (glyoxalase superfamily)